MVHRIQLIPYFDRSFFTDHSVENLQVATETGEDIDTGNKVSMASSVLAFLVCFWRTLDACVGSQRSSAFVDRNFPWQR